MNKGTNVRIRFEFENVEFLEPIEEDWQALVRVESDFFIFINKRILYQEVYFNVVEFAVSVSNWLYECKNKPKDYYFETMDSDEVGFVWFKQRNDKWQIGSIYQKYEENQLFEFVEIENAVKSFLENLLSSFPENAKKRVEKMLQTDYEF